MRITECSNDQRPTEGLRHVVTPTDRSVPSNDHDRPRARRARKLSDESPPTAVAITTAVVNGPPAKPGPGRARRGKPVGGLTGRPTKLTDARIQGIADTIIAGSTIELAFVLNGVSRRAGKYWLAMARELVERGHAEGKPAEAVDSPWPRLPAPLLVKFLNAVEHAKAVDEHNRIANITAAARGGAVLYERVEERVGEDGQVSLRVTVKRYAPPDWRADAWLLERRDPNRWGRPVRFATPGGDPGQGGEVEVPERLGILPQVWALKSKDPRALPPAAIETG